MITHDTWAQSYPILTEVWANDLVKVRGAEIAELLLRAWDSITSFV